MRTATLLPTAVVAGASSAIRAAIALRLARLGYGVCINYRDSADRALGVVDQIEAAEGRAIALRERARRRRHHRMTDQAATAFSRLWLGVRSATCLSWTDGLSASPDPLAKLDDVFRLPGPASDEDD
jgi:NAD(P)-dependent dehydrogenase (short-subunit alcohol dehydrogenase family)